MVNSFTCIGSLTADIKKRTKNTADGPTETYDASVAVNDFINGEQQKFYLNFTLWPGMIPYMLKGKSLWISGPQECWRFDSDNECQNSNSQFSTK